MSRPPPGGSAGASGVNRPSSAPLSHTGASKGTGTRMLCEPTGRAPPSFHSPEAVLSVNADPGENLTTPWGGGIQIGAAGSPQARIRAPYCSLSVLSLPYGVSIFFFFFSVFICCPLVILYLSSTCVLNRVRLFATLWTVADQAPQSMGFPRQEYWSGLPFPPPRVYFLMQLNSCLI